MKKNRKNKVAGWKVNPLDVRQKDVARIFNVTAQAVGMWSCPRLESGNYDLSAVVAWRLGSQKPESSSRVELENQKLTLQCEKMTLDIDKMKRETISLETYNQVFASRAMGLKTFIVEFFSKNLHHYAHKSIEQLRPLNDEHIAAMLNHYSSNHL